MSWSIYFSDCTGRQATVGTHDRTKRQMYIAFQVKPYYQDFYEDINFVNSKQDGDIPTYSVNITEVFEPHNHRAWKFNGPEQKEIE